MLNNAPPPETPNDSTHSLDNQWLVVQIPNSEIYSNDGDEKPIPPAEPSKNSSWLERHIKPPAALSHKHHSSSKATTGIRMTRAEFYAYFIKDEKTGAYRADTTEPAGGRKAWLQERLQRMKDDPASWDLWTRESRRLVATRGTGGIAAFGGLGGMGGMGGMGA